MKRKHNGNETNIAKFISFRFKFFRYRFVAVFLIFFVSISVNANHTAGGENKLALVSTAGTFDNISASHIIHSVTLYCQILLVTNPQW